MQARPYRSNVNRGASAAVNAAVGERCTTSILVMPPLMQLARARIPPQHWERGRWCRAKGKHERAQVSCEDQEEGLLLMECQTSPQWSAHGPPPVSSTFRPASLACLHTCPTMFFRGCDRARAPVREWIHE